LGQHKIYSGGITQERKEYKKNDKKIEKDVARKGKPESKAFYNLLLCDEKRTMSRRSQSSRSTAAASAVVAKNSNAKASNCSNSGYVR
jgi:hypothetical protein